MKPIISIALIVYREICCRKWSEDCEDVEELIREELKEDPRDECHELGG